MDIPKWVISLEKEHWLKKTLMDTIKEAAYDINHISDVRSILEWIEDCEYVARSTLDHIDLGKGNAKVSINLQGEPLLHNSGRKHRACRSMGNPG